MAQDKRLLLELLRIKQRLCCLIENGTGGGEGNGEPQNLVVESSGEGESTWFTDGDTLFMRTINNATVEDDESLTINGGGSSEDPLRSIIINEFSMSGATTAQPIFPASQDVFTLEADSTYEFEGYFNLGHGTTSHTVSLSWDVSGLTTHYFGYDCITWLNGAGTSTTAQTSTYVNSMSATSIAGTSGSNTENIKISGVIRVNAGGTITPMITFSADPGGSPVARVGTRLKFTKVGSGTATTSGAVS